MPEIYRAPLLACDLPPCQSTDGTMRYLIDAGQGPRTVILCETHALPVRFAYDCGERATKPHAARVLTEQRLLGLKRD